MTRLPVIVGALLFALFVLACGEKEKQAAVASPPPQGAASLTATQPTPGSSATASPAGPKLGAESPTYAGTANWLCQPAKQDTPCTGNMDATLIALDGTRTIEPFKPASNPAIDCLYIYPTVSTDSGVNSDLEPGEAERFTTISQAARLTSVCRLFVPMYRQITVTALSNGAFGSGAARDTAYGDVLAAWNHYLATENRGRGVILVGHSQGALHLTRLVREEIDPKPEARKLLVSAMLFGTTVSVPAGADVGGDFKNVPACRKPEQVGCVISYASFSEASPPPPLSIFGRRPNPASAALCVNPAALAGGSAPMHPYLRPASPPAGLTTSWVGYPGHVTAECATDGAFSYLKVTASGGLNLPSYTPTAEWGLHRYDVTVAMGDIVALAAFQAAAHR